MDGGLQILQLYIIFITLNTEFGFPGTEVGHSLVKCPLKTRVACA